MCVTRRFLKEKRVQLSQAPRKETFGKCVISCLSKRIVENENNLYRIEFRVSFGSM